MPKRYRVEITRSAERDVIGIYEYMAEPSPQRAVEWFAEMTPFEFLDVLTTHIMLPIAALLTALLVGYRMRREILKVELHREGRHFFVIWRACLRYIAPPAITVIMLTAIMQYL